MSRSTLMLAFLISCKGQTGDSADTDALDTDAPDTDVVTDTDTDTDTEPIDTDTSVPTGHPRVWVDSATIERLQAHLDEETDAAVRFRDAVDLQVDGADLYAFSPADVALMGVLTGDARYCTWAVAETDAFVHDEEERIDAGERAEVAGDSYLYVGPIVGDLALVYDWCNADLSADQRERWREYANQAVWNVWHPDDAEWGGESYPWSGWALDDPYNNYYYSFLRATAFLGLATSGEDDAAEGWLAIARDDKIRAQLLPVLNGELEGGGSREGTGYGVSLRELYELFDAWKVTTGEDFAAQTDHDRASILAMVHSTAPTLDRIAPTGDHARESSAALFDYHREYVLVLDHTVGDEPEAEIGKAWLDAISVDEMSQYFERIWEFRYEPDGPSRPLSELYPRYRAEGTGQIYLRSGWDTDATWLHYITGPYTQSHAHHDQGQLLVYSGEWLIYDQNINSHSGLQQGEDAHSLVRLVDGGGNPISMRESAPPAELLAMTDGDGFVYLHSDITPIYDGNPDLTRVERQVVFLEPDVIVIHDRVDAEPDVERIWQAQTPIEPDVDSNHVTLAGTAGQADLWWINGGTPESMEWTGQYDMNAGYRVDMPLSGNRVSHHLVVIGVNGVITTVEPAGSTDDDVGVRINTTTASGDVHFASDGTSVTINFGVVDTTVGDGVDTFPEFQ